MWSCCFIGQKGEHLIMILRHKTKYIVGRKDIEIGFVVEIRIGVVGKGV